MTTFEDQLWNDLVAEHGDQMTTASLAAPDPGAGGARPARRGLRRPAILTGGMLGTAGAATAAVLAFGAASTPPAFAVTDNADGSVTVTLNEISGITALNAELAADGIPAKAIPLTADCATRGFPNAMPSGTDPNTYTITIVPQDIPSGDTGIVAVSQNSSGQIQLAIGAWPSPGPSCLNSTPITTPTQP